MNKTFGLHPDLPHPFANAPMPVVEPISGLIERSRPATERHERGVLALAALINHWLGRSGLSHDQLCSLASWGLGEAGIIDSAVISRVRNGRQTKGASFKHLDALSAANQAIWLWQVRGQTEAWAKLGPHTGWGVREEWLATACWLPHPDDSEPLNFGDWAELLAGYLELPYLSTTDLSPAEARHASDALAALLEDIASQNGWGPRQAVQQLLERYPVTDRARQQRFRALIVGDSIWGRDELESELQAVAELIRRVRELDRYGPEDLQRELLSARRSGG
jgi:hypothetical protein